MLTEIICSGNQDRSPVAEMIAKQIVNLRNIKDLDIKSSGTHVNKYRLGDVPISGALYYINMGLELNLLSETEKKIAEKLHEGSYQGNIKDMFLITNDQLLRYAAHNKAEALRNLGFNPAMLKYSRDQTEPRSEEDHIIFCMNKKHIESMKQMYQGKEKKIMLLDVKEIQDPYCKSIGEYEETLKQICNAVESRVTEIECFQ
jgi:protein-tyrosine-phosphatase